MPFFKHIVGGISLSLFLLCAVAASVQAQVTTLPDNMVPTNCATDVTQQPWDAQVLHSTNDVHNYFVPIVGDIDGDGTVEIVAGKAVTNNHHTTIVGIYRGTDLQQIGTINVAQQVYAGFIGPMALVRYPDGNGGMQGAIILHCYDNKLRSYDIHGNLLATSDVNTPCEGVVSITDFNYDGWPEVYIGHSVYDAATLRLLCAGPANGNMGRCWRGSLTERANCAMSFAADLLDDSLPELICGNTLYQVTIASRTDVSLNSVTLLKTISIPSRIPQDGNVAVADFNMDGQLDVMVIIDGTPNDFSDSSYIYAYDPVSENILFTHGHYAKTIGYPMVGDIDGDEDLDFVYIDYKQPVSSSRITAMTFHPGSGLQTKWQATHADESGQTSMTLFDFNQDGIMEIVYRDQDRLRIINGSGRSHRTGNDTIPFYNLYAKSMSAGTWKEYPVVADVNNDGRAEIVTCGKVTSGLGWVGGQLWVIGGIHPWAPARPVWNQYMYNVTNINQNLTVPTPLFNNATPFTDPQGVVRRPFNNFLQQATTLDQYGRPFRQLLNVSSTTDTSITYGNDLTTCSFTFCNNGGQILSSPFSITYYADHYHGPIIRTETINNPLPVGNCMTVSAQFSDGDLLAFQGIETIVVAVNDNGTGVAQAGGQPEECDTSDNFFIFPINSCDNIYDTVRADICLHEPYSDINFDIQASETGNTGVFYYHRTFQVGDCDSIVVLRLHIHPAYDRHLSETIPEATDYDLHGLFFSAEVIAEHGQLDTSVTFQSVFGCDSTLHLSIAMAEPELTLYLPNAITPNGDGLNDFFSIPEIFQAQMGEFEICIYNRWGELGFHSNDKTFKWDGEFNGTVRHNIVYAYMIRYKDLIGEGHILKGVLIVL